MIDRASDADLAFLAMDQGPVPERIAIVLVLNQLLDAEACARLLTERITTVPRMRQRLVRTPPGCGSPIWLDDEAFDPHRHLEKTACRPPGDDRALLDTVLPHVLRPLPRDRPLWRAVLVDGLAGGGSALVLVVHHVLSDGLGGLAVLGQLVDGAARPLPRPVGRRPSARELATDAWRCRVAAVRASAVFGMGVGAAALLAATMAAVALAVEFGGWPSRSARPPAGAAYTLPGRRVRKDTRRPHRRAQNPA